MAFFDIPGEQELTPEVRRWLDELLRLRGIESVPTSWMVYARSPRLLEARVVSEAKLARTMTSFSWEARWIALMLVAHARRCDGCFAGSRGLLTALGFDEPALDGLCANPTELPLPERERIFVKYVLRIALSAGDIQPKDLRELQAHGLSREDVQDMVGFAAWAVMNTIFTTVANTAIRDD